VLARAEAGIPPQYCTLFNGLIGVYWPLDVAARELADRVSSDCRLAVTSVKVRLAAEALKPLVCKIGAFAVGVSTVMPAGAVPALPSRKFWHGPENGWVDSERHPVGEYSRDLAASVLVFP
jgi:hypothetical protein